MMRVSLQSKVGTFALDATLTVNEQVTLLIGPNGAGKSTFLKSVIGAIKPQSGRIRIGNDTLYCSQSGVDLPIEARRIAYVPQRYGLFTRMSVRKNIEFGVPTKEPLAREQAVEELLADLQISHLAERKAAVLSGGESQRVALARALAMQPRALLLDEPMAALDATSRKSVRSFLAQRLARINIPTLVVTHDPDDVGALGDNVAVLVDGKITATGSSTSLRESPPSAFVRSFLD